MKEQNSTEKNIMKEQIGFWDSLVEQFLQILAILAAGLISIPFGFGMFVLLRLGNTNVVAAICLAFFVTGMLMQTMKVETKKAQ